MPGTMDFLTRMGDAFKAADKLLLLVLQRASNEVRRRRAIASTTTSFGALMYM